MADKESEKKRFKSLEDYKPKFDEKKAKSRRSDVEDWLSENISEPLAEKGYENLGAGLAAAPMTVFDVLAPQSESEMYGSGALGRIVKAGAKAAKPAVKTAAEEMKTMARGLNRAERKAADLARKRELAKEAGGKERTLDYGGMKTKKELDIIEKSKNPETIVMDKLKMPPTKLEQATAKQGTSKLKYKDGKPEYTHSKQSRTDTELEKKYLKQADLESKAAARKRWGGKD